MTNGSPNVELHALRRCSACGSAGLRPSIAFSMIIDDAAKARGWTDADLAAETGISTGYAWTLRRPSKVRYRPSLTVASRIADALELDEQARAIVLASSNPGVGFDRADRNNR
jgi:transcriptional regulator with XRE-family HTH domain